MVRLDVVIKWLLGSYSLPQVVLLRCTFSILFIFWFAVGQGGLLVLRTDRPGWHVFRSLLMAGSTFAFFHALRFIPLADIMIIAFAAPLIVTLLSRPLLGEPVGPWRWSAVLIGFIGVVVVMRPGTGLIHPAAVIAFAGAFMYAGLSLTARKLSFTETTESLSLYLFGIPWLIAAVGTTGQSLQPPVLDWCLFALSGAFGGLAFVAINAAFRRAPAAVIVPFEYTALIWATAAGFLIWGEVPDAQTWLGAGIIIASGLFILYRETRVMRKPQVRVDFPLQDAVATDTDE
jgi:drug/metabolite transporter (DMT)-like permease